MVIILLVVDASGSNSILLVGALSASSATGRAFMANLLACNTR